MTLIRSGSNKLFERNAEFAASCSLERLIHQFNPYGTQSIALKKLPEAEKNLLLCFNSVISRHNRNSHFYGIMGPFSSRVKGVVEEDAHFYQLIREVLIANLHRHPPNICIEVGRQNTPHHVRPTFSDLEEALRGLKQDAA